jgi:hypothetical protein
MARDRAFVTAIEVRYRDATGGFPNKAPTLIK